MLKMLFVELLFKPKKFFQERISFCKKYYVWFIYIVGVGLTIGKLDEQILTKAFVSGGERYDFFSSMSWFVYWAIILILGIISGYITWLVWGWWYKIRIKWSGVKNPDLFESRLIYIFSLFIYSASMIVTTVLSSLFFTTPWESIFSESDNLYLAIVELIGGILCTVSLFWSIFISYVGVTTRFNVVKWKARIWFIILPAIVYTISVILSFLISGLLKSDNFVIPA